MNQRYAQKMNDRMIILLPTETKDKLAAVAHQRGVSVAELARRGIASIIANAA